MRRRGSSTRSAVIIANSTMERGVWLGLFIVNGLAIWMYLIYTENEPHRATVAIVENVTTVTTEPEDDDAQMEQRNMELQERMRLDLMSKRNGHEGKIKTELKEYMEAMKRPSTSKAPWTTRRRMTTSTTTPMPSTLRSCSRDGLHLNKRATKTNGRFQQVGNDTFVYEAYYDTRDSNTTYVRVIAVSPVNSTVFCHLWFPGFDEPLITRAEIYVRLYSKSVPYKSVLVNCPYNRTSEVAPEWLVLSPVECGPPHAILPVVNNRKEKMEANFTVCLHKALYNNYGWPELLVEWIETNRIFGAQKFLLYYYNHSESLMPYIKHYIQEGIVEYRSWPLHRVDKKISIYKAQVSVINDCIYRSMYKTKYLALLDPDELMVPSRHDNWADLMKVVPWGNEAGLMWRNHIYVLSEDQDPRYSQNKTLSSIRLNTLAYTKRQNFSWPCYIRTKLMLRPERTVDCDTHVTAMWEDSCLDPRLGTLHHYREWSVTVNKTVTKELRIFGLNKNMHYEPEEERMVVDSRMYNWAEKIYNRVKHVFDVVKV